jgi:Ca2+-binding EF-hand superfamily protein
MKFESTRIEEPRLKTLEKVIIVPEKIRKVNRIDDGLVEFDQIMAGWEDPSAENENMKLMKKSVFGLFRSYDREDLGMVSKEEFFDVLISPNSKLLRTLGVVFSPEEVEIIYDHFNLNKNGLLSRLEVNPIIIDILMGHIFFNTAEKERDARSVGSSDDL